MSVTITVSTYYIKVATCFLSYAYLHICFITSWLIWVFAAFLWKTKVYVHLGNILAKFLYSVEISARVMFCAIKWLSESKFV